MDPELTRKYRESACAFFGAQKSKTSNEKVLKLDGTDIPIDDAFDLFRNIGFDPPHQTTTVDSNIFFCYKKVEIKSKIIVKII